MSLHLIKTALATALVMATLTGVQAADRGASPAASSIPTDQRSMAARHKSARIVSFKMKCAVFSLTGGSSRHIAVWRANGVPVPAGTKVKLKVLNQTSNAVLPAIGQGAKHMVLNATPSPVPHTTPCQAKVI